MNLSILYRGPLASCNYDCNYCPFAKQRDSPEQLALDQEQLDRFVNWVEQRTSAQTDVLFTPWGEALVRPWYRAAMVRLSQLPQVGRVAIQTNLSCHLDWLEEADRETLGFWCTYHPAEVSLDRFIQQCAKLDAIGVRYSVGVVGLKEHFDDIESLRQTLSPHVYLWINALKRDANYYSAADIERLVAIDPLFELNNRRHLSRGLPCRTGESVVSVDGAGDVRRCHFISEVIGNIYDTNFEESLRRRPCSAESCGCHIGYVHLKPLDLYDVFGRGVLDRIPDRPVCRDDAAGRLQVLNSDSNLRQMPTGL